MKLREFSAAIGLSISTVSRALNGYKDVNEETRRKVTEAAARLGYSPDPIGRRLRTQSASTIAIVLSPPQTHFANPFFLDVVTGLDEGLRDTPFQLIVTSARSLEEELSVFQRLVEKQRVDALVFSRIHKNDARIRYLQKAKVPFVTLGRNDSKPAYSFVFIDHRVMGREGCARLIARGHRRIALLNTPDFLMASHYRRHGYEAALQAAGLAAHPELLATEAMTEEGGRRGAARLLAQRRRPTAILCGHDLMAMGALQAIRDAGLVPGRDIAVIGSDNNPLGQFTNPPLTTFSAPMAEAGQRAAQMALAQLAGTPAAELQETWAPTLVIRKSDNALAPAKRGDARRRIV